MVQKSCSTWDVQKPVNNVVIPGKHDLRLAGEKAIDFQRWPLEATRGSWSFLSLISLNMGLPETLDDAFELFACFFPMGLQRAI